MLLFRQDSVSSLACTTRTYNFDTALIWFSSWRRKSALADGALFAAQHQLTGLRHKVKYSGDSLLIRFASWCGKSAHAHSPTSQGRFICITYNV